MKRRSISEKRVLSVESALNKEEQKRLRTDNYLSKYGGILVTIERWVIEEICSERFSHKGAQEMISDKALSGLHCQWKYCGPTRSIQKTMIAPEIDKARAENSVNNHNRVNCAFCLHHSTAMEAKSWCYLRLCTVVVFSAHLCGTCN
ncbi:hypothetical protein KIN20_012621 [Parelaphostrongylus tenuis]|uniref:Uncharacterized protein n=1 Tax=Parelaphostrongylus tenuis TaxID=148309 RepID=A0AAD5QMX7_PARTN|nr:hypothetical protein KIN20_012621 [Parelaphostrongylus tenuis]